ncbi:U3 small nucleolar RNA-associated protein 20 [[Candida] railenensis]|uniref:U3 small nucleolar RNA-associated protein 20 n=1 Tax=[Candida] railenensis TaxID=45579 RepID=A0A9P0QPH9_9ASCO|nr:U3 small nucleolar RNA-associated protein 20 [[Candida] railenensis]
MVDKKKGSSSLSSSRIEKKKTKSTQSSRRHAFSSFRERIDSIKIDPNLTLSKRSFDDAEISHFLSTLDHWKEINISGNFTEFIDKIEGKCQSLPQLLHHQDFIFEAIYSHIQKNDVYSIQPLFELLGQFVHDLGVDFLDHDSFYSRTLDLIMEIAISTNPNDSQNNRNSANILEWSFNCLAFIFKYLNKSLAKDLLPTFTALLPLLKLNTKRYISRYCAEALSFLIRKSKDDSLDNIILASLNENDLEEESYYQSLVIMYSESMKSTNGSFHSKSQSIFIKLLDNGIKQHSAKHISNLSDIILSILNHGSLEACDKFYRSSVNYLIELLDKSDDQQDVTSLITISQILLTLSFAESGKKVKTWNPILMALEKFLNLINSESVSTNTTLVDSLIYLLSVVFRNCSIDELTKYQLKYFETMKNIDNGKSFFKFVETSMDLCETRMNSYGLVKHVQDFINSIVQREETYDFKILALFLTKRAPYAQGLIIPYNIQVLIQSQLENDFKSIEGNEFEIYWRVLILEYSDLTKQSDLQFNYINSIFKELLNKESRTKFDEDIAAHILEFMALHSEKNSLAILKIALIENLDKFQESYLYLSALDKLLKKDEITQKKVAIEIISKNFDTICDKVSLNLRSPNHDVRYSSLNLIVTLFQLKGLEVPQIISDIRIIEEIPLSLNTGRDISSRIRSLGIEFKKSIAPSSLESLCLTRYLFGLLTNKFQPCWLAVFEVLPMITFFKECSEEIWKLSYEFINMKYSNQIQNYNDIDDSMFVDEDLKLFLADWLPNDSRLSGNFNHINRSYFIKYSAISNSLMAYSKERRGDFYYGEIMRSQVLQALSFVPQIAELHSEILVPLVLHKSDIEEGDDDDETDVSENPHGEIWSMKDRNALVGLFSKFSNLKKVYKSEEVFEHMLKLLCNKQLPVQKMALSVILNWKIGVLNKYRDNLLNLLDNTIFRDEISKFITQDSESKIEDQDLKVLMPIVLRILFGRSQSAPKSNSQSGRKFAIITVLPNLKPEDIIEFLKLGSERIGYNGFFAADGVNIDNAKEISLTTMRRINGFVKLLNEVYGVLGLKYQDVLATTIEPLIYSLIVSQVEISNNELGSNSNLDKSARNVRQIGMKCLSDLFVLLGESFNWDERYVQIIYQYIINPRLEKFSQENLQQVSSLMKMMAGWINFKNLFKFYYIDDFAPVDAILSLLANENCKDSVVLTVLTFVHDALNKTQHELDNNDAYYSLLAQIVNELLKSLPSILDRSCDSGVNTKGVDILLLLLEQDYVDDNKIRGSLVESLTRALDKPHIQVGGPRNKVNILKSLSSLIDNYENCSFGDIESLYHSCSKSFRIYKEKNIRETLVSVFRSFGKKFSELQIVSELVEGLNAYSDKRIEEPDFGKRLVSFKKINDELYPTLTTTQWFPILNCVLFFINDELELAIRTNATFTINRFIDAFSQMENEELARGHIHMFKDTVLPNIRTGLRNFATVEVVQTEYVSVLAHTVQHSKYFNDLDDMKVLLFNNDEEANFFANVNHIQLHRRQRAIKRLRDYRHKLTEGSISHYILPIIEHYAFCTDEKLRNISNETVDTISDLARCISWNQFRALVRRYIGNLKKSKPESLRDHVSLIVAVSRSLMKAPTTSEFELEEVNIPDENEENRNLPSSQLELDTYITSELCPPIAKILNVRNDETIVARIRLAEALTNLVTCISENLIESQLPSILTSTCQVIRSRSEELRDAVRKSLGRISLTLGTKYFKFILQELKTSLSRGSQIHVLSFTVHTLIVNISANLNHGDLDESAESLVSIIMEDIFGAAGQEKDAEGYTSKMKEVKFNKSFDTGELLSSNISLKTFKTLVSPIKMLLQENVSLKVQNKLDELLRRYALGLNHNSESSEQSILVLCYELHSQATDIANRSIKSDDNKKLVKRGGDGNEGHFLVKLNARPQKTHVQNTAYITTLQKFSFDLLRTAISRHEELLTVPKLEGFIPLLENALQTSENEGVIISCLRILNLIVRLPFSEDIENVFKSCARRSLTITKDCPSTNSELCQACLRFLATVIRHKPEIKLKETAISYILVRIQPDLEEPNRQGLAFAFVKSVLSQHIMIPEVYDTMDKVSQIMIVNHGKEIRDMSRSSYFQFLMEYDQGRGRLEKQFKFLLNNLSYPTQDGRSSVMELIHLIIIKAGSDLLEKLASSFFIGLANVMVSDDTPKCREMASVLLGSMFKKLGQANTKNIESYCSSWISQSDNRLLQRCGLQVYKLYTTEFGIGNKSLDDLALKRMKEILDAAKNKGEVKEEEPDIEWELVYSALTVFSMIASALKDDIFKKEYAKIWNSILDLLLYPHPWVRLIACRLVGILLSNLDSIKFDLTSYEVQTVAYRLLHQLGAPSIAEALGGQIVKNLVIIAMKWEKVNQVYEFKPNGKKGDVKEEEEGARYEFAIDYLVTRISSIMRQENNYRDSFVSKKSSIQLAAMLVQIISSEKLPFAAEKLMLGMYNFNDLDPNNSEAEAELVNLTAECNQMIENKLGVTQYTQLYTQVKQIVNKRRQDRKTKRAQLNITAPDIAAKRKMRKHERFREKRKHEKDDNGYYKTKRNKFS